MNHSRPSSTPAICIVLLVGVCNVAVVTPAVAASPALFPEGTITLSADGANNTVSGILHLRNDTDQDRQITLTASDFVNQTTKKGLNARTVFFGPKDNSGQMILDATLPKNSRLAVRIESNNVWEAGESVATLYNQGDSIGTIKVVKFRPPFNVTLVAAPAEKPDLSFSKGEAQQLTLRNGDGMTYTVQVTVTIAGQPQTLPHLILGPNSSSAVTIQPPDGWFTPAGLVREEVREGTVTLAFRPEGDTAAPGWPEKVIPFKARLSRAPTFWLDLTGYAFIFMLLFSGGICSLLLANWVPNQLARAKLKARLSQLAERTRGLSSNRIGTRLQVALRVARQRLYVDLYSRWSGSAELPTVLAAVSQRADALEKIIEQVEGIDYLLAKVTELYVDGASPKQLDMIEAQLRNAKHLLSRIDPPQADVQVAKGLVEQAKASLENLGRPDDAFAQALAGRIQSLQAMKSPADPKDPAKVVFAAEYREFADILRDLFQRLGSFQAGGSIKPEDYGLADSAATRIELIREYVSLNAGLDKKARDKLAAVTPFSALIQADNLSSRAAAKRVIQYMREEIFPADIIAAIKSSANAPSIRMDPQTARQYSPMHFWVEFPKPEYNSCAALEDVRCEWDFNHLGLREEGWRVWHYFPDATTKENQKVAVTFTDVATGERIERNPIEKDLPVIAERSLQFGDRNWAELVRLLIALTIALLGLLAGAREQLLKLDLIPAAVAVFLLGFGADTIKNLLAPKEK